MSAAVSHPWRSTKERDSHCSLPIVPGASGAERGTKRRSTSTTRVPHAPCRNAMYVEFPVVCKVPLADL